MIFITILKKMLKLDFLVLIINQIDHWQKEKQQQQQQQQQKMGVMKDQLGGTITMKYVGLRAKTYSYLIDNGSEDKKARGTKK